MSININVHGNPESYSFNKNALCNFDSMKDAEYKRRKLLRLEQVIFTLQGIQSRILFNYYFLLK